MKTEFPAGRYYVGDLCYVKAIDWNKFCDATIVGQECLNGDFTIDGIHTWHHDTAYGDGDFSSNSEFSFPVDAGLIGVVSEEVALRGKHNGGHLIDFTEPFTPYYEDGKFFIGHLVIDTKGSDEFYEDDSL